MTTNFTLKSTVLIGLMTITLSFGSFQNTASAQINYKSQALYIYVFIKNIHWPQTVSNGHFVIGVFGNSPIYDELQTMASLKKTATGQTIVVKKLNSVEEIDDNVHLLYVTSSKSRDIKKIAEKLEGAPTLVVAERDGLAKKGASINFVVMENDTLKFEVNTAEMQAHNLQISDELLKRGYIVR